MRATIMIAAMCSGILACSGREAPTSALGSAAPDGKGAVLADADGPALMRTVQETAARRALGTQALPITYHNGPVTRATKMVAIYWGNATLFAGGPAPGTTGPGSADASIVGDFLRNLGGSPYWSINNEYTDRMGGRVGSALTYTAYWAPSPGPNPVVGDMAVRAQIAAGLTSGALAYDQQTIYLVFAGPGVNLGGGFGSAYCAYHYYFSWGTKKVLYAVLPWVQDLPGVCTRLQGSPNDDFGADAIVTPIAHEVEEAATDPGITSWYDAVKDENADKCVWTFGTTYTTANGAMANIRLGSRDYLVQQNWKLSLQTCGMS